MPWRLRKKAKKAAPPAKPADASHVTPEPAAPLQAPAPRPESSGGIVITESAAMGRVLTVPADPPKRLRGIDLLGVQGWRRLGW
jgi:hypothetical protein